MGNYEDWNTAIADYFLAGAAKGSPIFLSLDTEAIIEIASGFLTARITENHVEDFLGAVRSRVISKKNKLTLDGLDKKINGIPGGVAFLGLMVYAAHNMQEEAGIDDANYFIRLRELLNLPGERRPDGLPAGTEEPLWRQWNSFLLKSGFQKTAHRGSGPRTFLQYVISQAILRESDKQYLANRFSEARLQPNMDPEQIGYWLADHHLTRKHLTAGLNHDDSSRRWEFYQAAHSVYQSADWSTIGGHPYRPSSIQNRNIECGLYRAENLMGESEYYLFPKQPSRTRAASIYPVARYDTDSYQLEPLRPGFFHPLWENEPFVETPLEIPVEGDPRFQKLVFPKRDFWLLVRDPENTYGAWATWRPYVDVGEEFLLLCRKGKISLELENFKKAGLINWDRSQETDTWVEFQDCMVLYYDWSELIVDDSCQQLVNALTPRSAAGISLVGGLRDPNSSAWLEGCPPAIRIIGFEKEFELAVRLADGDEIYRADVAVQKEVTLHELDDPDIYQIEVWNHDRRVALKILRVIPWDKIVEAPQPKPVINDHPLSTAGLRLQGPKLHSAEVMMGGSDA